MLFLCCFIPCLAALGVRVVVVVGGDIILFCQDQWGLV